VQLLGGAARSGASADPADPVRLTAYPVPACHAPAHCRHGSRAPAAAKCLVPGRAPVLQCGCGEANTVALRPADPGTVLARLRSPDPQARARAMHAICPCGAGFRLYERFRSEVKRLQKDPNPAVRTAALPIAHDACEIETIEAGLDRAGRARSGSARWAAGKGKGQDRRD
jgi:hypothetical protein